MRKDLPSDLREKQRKNEEHYEVLRDRLESGIVGLDNNFDTFEDLIVI